MKRLYFFLFFSLSVFSHGQVINLNPDSTLYDLHILGIPESYYIADYYVATDGNDANPFTYDQPFATWQKGFETANAGDTVYIRGGTYAPTDPISRSNDSCGVPDGDILFCGWNGPDDGTRRVALFFAMDGITDIEQEEIFNIFNKWKWW